MSEIQDSETSADRAARERIAKLHAVTAALSEARLPVDVARVVAVQMASVLGADQAILAVPAPDGKELVLLGHRGLRGDTAEAFARFPVDIDLPVATAFQTGQPVWIGSRAELLARYPRRAEVTTEAIACAPLIVNGAKLGAVGFGFDRPRGFDAAERSLTEDLATHAALALERAELYRAEQLARRRLELLAQAGRRFAEAGLDLEPLLDSIVAELGAALEGSAILSLIGDDAALHPRAVHHPDAEARDALRALAVPVGQGLTGSVASTGQSVLVPAIGPGELAARALPQHRALFARFPIHALICVPLRSRGSVIGTLAVARIRQGETYAADDLLLVEEIADRASLALDNSRLYEENAAAAARGAQLYRFAGALVAAQRAEEVFQAALDVIETTLGARRASILAFDDAGVMRFRAWRGLSDGYRAAVEGHSPWPRDAASPEPVLVADVEHAPALSAFLPVFRAEGIQAVAFIPLVSGGRLIGKFMVYYDRPHRYTAHEVQLAAAIANYLASAMERFAAVDALRASVGALRESEERFRAMADDTPLVIWVTDARGVIQFVNRAYCEFFGTTRELVQAAGWQPMVHPDDAAAYVEAFFAALRERTEFRAQARVRRADGEWRWVDSHGQPRYAGSGELLGMAGSSPDITERKLAEEELRRSLQYYDMFVGVLSHDLRDPLGAITTAASLLSLREESERIARPLSRIMRSANRMGRMISQLLDFTRIRLGAGIPLERKRVDLAELCRAVADEIEAAHERDIRVTATGEPTGTWDPDRLSQLVSNLAANACQHGAPDTPVELVLDGSDARAVRLEVRNRGTIPGELLAIIFEPLRRAEGSARKSPAGLGLGLYISQQIALAHGGTIRVDSDAERTAFIVELPRQPQGEVGQVFSPAGEPP